jgi:hypothetical protein
VVRERLLAVVAGAGRVRARVRDDGGCGGGGRGGEPPARAVGAAGRRRVRGAQHGGAQQRPADGRGQRGADELPPGERGGGQLRVQRAARLRAVRGGRRGGAAERGAVREHAGAGLGLLPVVRGGLRGRPADVHLPHRAARRRDGAGRQQGGRGAGGDVGERVVRAAQRLPGEADEADADRQHGRVLPHAGRGRPPGAGGAGPGRHLVGAGEPCAGGGRGRRRC